MLETALYPQVIRCQHKKDGKSCNNVICVKDGDVVTVKRHGREIRAFLIENHPLAIVCERCKSETKIFL